MEKCIILIISNMSPFDVEWSPADRDDISQMNNL